MRDKILRYKSSGRVLLGCTGAQLTQVIQQLMQYVVAGISATDVDLQIETMTMGADNFGTQRYWDAKYLTTSLREERSEETLMVVVSLHQ